MANDCSKNGNQIIFHSKEFVSRDIANGPLAGFTSSQAPRDLIKKIDSEIEFAELADFIFHIKGEKLYFLYCKKDSNCTNTILGWHQVEVANWQMSPRYIPGAVSKISLKPLKAAEVPIQQVPEGANILKDRRTCLLEYARRSERFSEIKAQREADSEAYRERVEERVEEFVRALN